MENKIVFSENEYISLRSEMIERIRLLNSQSFSALATIISFWAAGFTFKFALIANDKYFLELNEKIVMQFLSAVIFLLPIFIFIPLSVKSGENLMQITSLSAYIRVFYDYPVCCDKMNRNWETSNNLFSNANVNRKKRSRYMKVFNGEYVILSITSFLIYLVFEVLNIKSLIMLLREQKISSLNLHMVLMLYLLITILSIIVMIIINKVSSMKNTLMDKNNYYVKGYIKRANELGIIKDEDLEKAIFEMNPLRDYINEI